LTAAGGLGERLGLAAVVFFLLVAIQENVSGRAAGAQEGRGRPYSTEREPSCNRVDRTIGSSVGPTVPELARGALKQRAQPALLRSRSSGLLGGCFFADRAAIGVGCRRGGAGDFSGAATA
jgi:hypothetical protein